MEGGVLSPFEPTCSGRMLQSRAGRGALLCLQPCSHQLTATSKIISQQGWEVAGARCSLAEILDKVPRTQQQGHWDREDPSEHRKPRSSGSCTILLLPGFIFKIYKYFIFILYLYYLYNTNILYLNQVLY